MRKVSKKLAFDIATVRTSTLLFSNGGVAYLFFSKTGRTSHLLLYAKKLVIF